MSKFAFSIILSLLVMFPLLPKYLKDGIAGLFVWLFVVAALLGIAWGGFYLVMFIYSLIDGFSLAELIIFFSSFAFVTRAIYRTSFRYFRERGDGK